ncbi:predicted protein [Lichtheimia corymbifera JMRC:FSU:9682]|uniref:Uncharacterized protein n=1 Tax=Lichtheimia corymbifera JMRC:FSU:9682 TaxID=1263082 RepID=A0A068SH42_9FUNG|nr:predicted protein [Lichtheimia corymbifera JMRC:FSU:9682]
MAISENKYSGTWLSRSAIVWHSRAWWLWTSQDSHVRTILNVLKQGSLLTIIVQSRRYCQAYTLFSVVSRRKLKREQASDESPKVVVVALTRNQEMNGHV